MFSNDDTVVKLRDHLALMCEHVEQYIVDYPEEYDLVLKNDFATDLSANSGKLTAYIRSLRELDSIVITKNLAEKLPALFTDLTTAIDKFKSAPNVDDKTQQFCDNSIKLLTSAQESIRPEIEKLTGTKNSNSPRI
jgi:hypothetical protein